MSTISAHLHFFLYGPRAKPSRKSGRKDGEPKTVCWPPTHISPISPTLARKQAKKSFAFFLSEMAKWRICTYQKVNKYNGANSLISILPRREDKGITFRPVSLISLSVFSPIRTSLVHSSPWSPSAPYRNQIIVLDLSKSPSFSFSFSRIAFTLSHWLSKELWYTREQMISSGVGRCGMSGKTNLFFVSSEQDGGFSTHTVFMTTFSGQRSLIE